MFSVEVRTSKPWVAPNKPLKPEVWTSLSNKKHSSKKEAEVEVAYITLQFEDMAEVLKDFKVDYRIVNGSNVVWTREEHYNP